MSYTGPSAKPLQPSRVLPLLAVLFAASGCAALIYEIVWYQLLQFSIGSSAISLAILLATFMGGLCLGSIALPRIPALRRYHPLRVYAVLEIAIGLCGTLVLVGIPLVNRIYVAAVGHGLSAMLLRAIVCSLCLVPATLLMGASLPAVARWLEFTPKGVSWLGLLYAANTLGAVFGCLLAGFYLLRVFDMRTATFIAAALNALVAAISFGLAARTPAHVAADGGLAPQGTRPEGTRPEATGSPRLWPIYLTIALSGACALGAEAIWTRLLGLIMGATVYTFSIILAVFLAGLGIGSNAGSIFSRMVQPQKALGYCQLLLTVAVAWTAFMLAGSLPYWPISATPSNPWFAFQLDLARTIWAILPATILWGASFPLALSAAAVADADPARVTGGIYAANTGGAIIGALAFSVFLVPAIGTRGSERLLIVLSAVSALCALAPPARSSQSRSLWSQSLRSQKAALWLSASAIVAAVLALSVPAVPPGVIAYGRSFMTLSPSSRILYTGEGMNSSIAISTWDNILQFHVSGKVEASTGTFDMRLQRMLGHLPALIHPQARSILVVGFGAGVTAGSFVEYPGLQRLTICEIEPLIPPVATRYFGKENHNVLTDPRTKIVYDDARHYILTTPEKFDVITSDPIHPWVKGSATLYTREYFELVKKHLNPGGIVTQWVPLYETDLATVKSELATFFDVFPGGSVWANEANGGGYDILLLGQASPVKIDLDEVQRRLDAPEYALASASLRDVGLGSAIDILATYAGQAPDLKTWLKGADINRDGNLRLQYLAGLAANDARQQAIYDELLRHRRFPAGLIVGSDPQIQTLRGKFGPADGLSD